MVCDVAYRLARGLTCEAAHVSEGVGIILPERSAFKVSSVSVSLIEIMNSDEVTFVVKPMRTFRACEEDERIASPADPKEAVWCYWLHLLNKYVRGEMCYLRVNNPLNTATPKRGGGW